jgi:hypothetical protein
MIKMRKSFTLKTLFCLFCNRAPARVRGKSPNAWLESSNVEASRQFSSRRETALACSTSHDLDTHFEQHKLAFNCPFKRGGSEPLVLVAWEKVKHRPHVFIGGQGLLSARSCLSTPLRRTSRLIYSAHTPRNCFSCLKNTSGRLPPPFVSPFYAFVNIFLPPKIIFSPSSSLVLRCGGLKRRLFSPSPLDENSQHKRRGKSLCEAAQPHSPTVAALNLLLPPPPCYPDTQKNRAKKA